MLGPDGRVARVLHGPWEMNADEVAAEYSAEEAARLAELLRAGQKHRDYVFYMTYFDTPAALAFMHLVEHVDNQPQGGSPEAYNAAFDAIGMALNFNFNSDHFSQRKVVVIFMSLR